VVTYSTEYINYHATSLLGMTNEPGCLVRVSPGYRLHDSLPNANKGAVLRLGSLRNFLSYFSKFHEIIISEHILEVLLRKFPFATIETKISRLNIMMPIFKSTKTHEFS
jgi:hypothetical protein